MKCSKAPIEQAASWPGDRNTQRAAEMFKCAAANSNGSFFSRLQQFFLHGPDFSFHVPFRQEQRHVRQNVTENGKKPGKTGKPKGASITASGQG
jgi:hypothetical protein